SSCASLSETGERAAARARAGPARFSAFGALSSGTAFAWTIGATTLFCSWSIASLSARCFGPLIPSTDASVTGVKHPEDYARARVQCDSLAPLKLQGGPTRIRILAELHPDRDPVRRLILDVPRARDEMDAALAPLVAEFFPRALKGPPKAQEKQPSRPAIASS